MILGLDGDVDGWMPSKLNGATTQVPEDCFGQKFWQTDPLMLESIDGDDEWNNIKDENREDFNFDLFHGNAVAEEAKNGLCAGETAAIQGDMTKDANSNPYDRSAESFIPFCHQPSIDGSNHDSTHGYQGSPRESSLWKREQAPVLDQDNRAKHSPALQAGGISKRTSRRVRKPSTRLVDSITSLPTGVSLTSASKSLQTTVAVSQGKSYLSDQMSSSEMKPQKASKSKLSDGKGVVNSKGTASSHPGKVRGAQAIRATSARTEMKGRPSFAELVSSGIMKPGVHRFSVGHVEVLATVGDDGAINYDGSRYRAVSKFALTVLRMRNPARQSCDGWKEVSWNGEKLDKLRILCLRRQNSNMRTGQEHF